LKNDARVPIFALKEDRNWVKPVAPQPFGGRFCSKTTHALTKVIAATVEEGFDHA
jgi:hypothetical protein